MKKAWQIFKRDIRRIGTNFVAMVVLIGVCLIPSLYAWFNIAANMDPYANTAGIKIAVANNDAGTDNKMVGKINVGDQVQNKLKENDSLGWTFVEEDAAVEGVRSGEYYAAIVMPDDFSEDMVSILSGDIHTPEIEYYLNEKKNAIAPKVTDTGATTVQNQINQTFVAVVSETVTDILNETSGDVREQVDTAQADLQADLTDAQEILEKYDAAWAQFQKTYKSGKKALGNTDEIFDSIDKSATSGRKTIKANDKLFSTTRKSLYAFSGELNNSLTQGQILLGQAGTAINTRIGEINAPIQQATGDINSVITSSQGVVEMNESIIKDLEVIADKYPGSDAAQMLEDLKKDNERHKEVLASLKTANAAIANTSNTVTNLSTSLNTILTNNMETIGKSKTSFESTALPALNTSLDSFAKLSGTMDGILSGVQPTTAQMRELVANLDTSLDQTYKGLELTAASIDDLQESLNDMIVDFNALVSSRNYQEFMAMSDIDGETVAGIMSSPINLETESFFAVRNYGSGVTPFYTNLAIWVSGLVLISIFKMEVYRDKKVKKFTPSEAYFGRWILFVIVGLIQSLIVCVGDILFMGVQCVHPFAFILAGLVISFVYINLIYALSITFKHIGKAVCIILVILQIPGSAGTYPIEMMPGFYRVLNSLLPFTYGIKAMRECVAGFYNNLYWKNLGVMLIYVAISMFIGLVIRPWMMNLNNMFDKRLEETGMMVCDEYGNTLKREKVNNVLKALSSDDETREQLIAKAESFEEGYRKKVRVGFMLIVTIPILLLLLMYGVNSKLVMLTLWIIAVIGISGYLIVIEYLHENLKNRLQYVGLSEDELMTIFKENQKGVNQDA